jgi:ABC-2 type transport system permease protein
VSDARYKRFSLSRVAAMLARQIYVLRASWPRLLEIIYWPAISMVTWGFAQVWVNEQSGGTFTAAASTLLAGVMLWDVLVRGGLGFAITFLEEMWAKNIGNLLMSPLTLSEFVMALASMSVIRLLIGFIPVSFIAIALFGFNIWALGLPLIAFFINLIVLAWAVSLVVSGLILRHGMGAEGLAWIAVFVMMPFSAIFYPVSVLPEPAQYVAWALPAAYVFEGMRALVIDGVFRGDYMLWAVGLNAIYVAAAILLYARILESARVAGSLLSSAD